MYLSNIYYESKMLGAFARDMVQSKLFEFLNLEACCDATIRTIVLCFVLRTFDLSSSPWLGLELTTSDTKNQRLTQ